MRRTTEKENENKEEKDSEDENKEGKEEEKREEVEKKNAFIYPKLGEMCVVTEAHEELQRFHELNIN